MKKINVGDTVVLLMDIKDHSAPFYAKVGYRFVAMDICIDPMMPSGYAVVIQGYGPIGRVDKQAVVHYDDWKNIYNSVIDSLELVKLR
jgi:hypothetical protein